MQQFLEDMLLEPEFAIALLDRTISTQIRLYENFLDAVGKYLDVVETYDDLGAQTGPLISPRLYRKIVKPAHERLFAAIHARTRAKVFFHSCGAVMPFIDDMVEIGVDILNPIQPLPGLMDPEELKTRWGERLVFHGGLDVQQLLYQGTPDEVRAFVRRYLDILGPERYIMSPTCPVLPGTPAENVAAAFDAAASYTREQ
jgi:uroporphyrinogen decarboxylase